MQFSSLVRKTREEKGMLVKDLATKANVTTSYISLIEHGRKNPRITNAVRIARALKIDVGQLRWIEETVRGTGFLARGYGKKGKKIARAGLARSRARPTKSVRATKSASSGRTRGNRKGLSAARAKRRGR